MQVKPTKILSDGQVQQEGTGSHNSNESESKHLREQEREENGEAFSNYLGTEDVVGKKGNVC